ATAPRPCPRAPPYLRFERNQSRGPHDRSDPVAERSAAAAQPGGPPRGVETNSPPAAMKQSARSIDDGHEEDRRCRDHGGAAALRFHSERVEEFGLVAVAGRHRFGCPIRER